MSSSLFVSEHAPPFPHTSFLLLVAVYVLSRSLIIASHLSGYLSRSSRSRRQTNCSRASHRPVYNRILIPLYSNKSLYVICSRYSENIIYSTGLHLLPTLVVILSSPRVSVCPVAYVVCLSARLACSFFSALSIPNVSSGRLSLHPPTLFFVSNFPVALASSSPTVLGSRGAYVSSRILA